MTTQLGSDNFFTVMATMNKPNRIKEVESFFAGLINKHEMTVGGEEIYPDIAQWSFGSEETHIVFEDEEIASLLAGYVSETIYNEMEEGLKGFGFNIIDTDGNKMILERI